MAEEVAAQSAEDLELLTQPVKPTYNKYSLITFQGMLAQIIMVVLEGVIMGIGLGAHGLACVSATAWARATSSAPSMPSARASG